MSNPTKEVIEEAWRLQEEGRQLHGKGRYSEAAIELKSGLSLVGWYTDRESRSGSPVEEVTSRLLISLALTEVQLGNSGYSLDLLRQAEEIVATEDRGILENQRGMILRKLGRNSDALKSFNRAEPYLEIYGPDWLYAGLFLNRSTALTNLGEMKQALADIGKAENLIEKQGNPVHLAKVLQRRSVMFGEWGDYVESLAKLKEARELYRQHAPHLLQNADQARASQLIKLGMHRQAISILRPLIENDDLVDKLNRGYLSQTGARAARSARDFGTAQKWARLARDLFFEIGYESQSYSAALIELECQFEAGDFRPGMANQIDQLRQALKRRGDIIHLSWANILSARAFIREGNFQQAHELLGYPIYQGGFEMITSRLGRYLAKAELAVKLGRDPLSHLRAGLSFMDERRSLYGSIEFQAGASVLSRQLANKGLEIVAQKGNPHTTFSWTERVRAQSLQVPPTDGTLDDETKAKMAQLRKHRNQLWEKQLKSEDSQDLVAKVADLESQLRDHSWYQDGPGTITEKVTPSQVKKLAITTNSIVVSFFEHEGLLSAVTVSSEGYRQVQLADLDYVDEVARRTNADLDALASDYLPPPIQQSVSRSLQTNVTELTKAVWEPLTELADGLNVVIVPTRSLNWVPWGMLPPLVGRPVSVSPSASVWWRCQQVETTHENVVLASGPALREVEREVESVAACYPNPTVLAGDDARPEAILQAIDGASVAHLAAHGEHESDNVLFSRLNFHEGPLMAYDLSQLSQPPAEVVLSACDLGRSTVNLGDETLGFTAALLHAGTVTVIASLTRVPDGVAAEMMSAYARARSAGMPPAVALAEAGKGHSWHPFICFGRS